MTKYKTLSNTKYINYLQKPQYKTKSQKQHNFTQILTYHNNCFKSKNNKARLIT